MKRIAEINNGREYVSCSNCAYAKQCQVKSGAEKCALHWDLDTQYRKHAENNRIKNGELSEYLKMFVKTCK